MADRTPVLSQSTVEPYEAKGLELTLSEEGVAAFHDVMTAVNGWYYPGDRSDAVASALAWLQTHPEQCAALGLGALPTAESGSETGETP